MADLDGTVVQDSLDGLNTSAIYSIVCGDSVVSIVGLDLWDSDLLYVWVLMNDAESSARRAIAVKKIDKILKKFFTNGFSLFTISKKGPMQDRFHEFGGFEKQGETEEGDVIWVKLQAAHGKV